MSAYYNEFEPYAAEWLRNLIKEGLIADGDVDERSIKDVGPSDLRGYTQCHFFAGIGGWSYALRLAGWGDSRPVFTGSPPCQPFSVAGQQKGAVDERHLWPEYFRLIRECRPATCFGEQVAAAIGRGWLDAVFTDLEAEGYACAASVLPACSVGAPHLRQRLWFVADADFSIRRWDSGGIYSAEGSSPSSGDIDGRDTDGLANGGAVSKWGNADKLGPQGRQQHGDSAGKFTTRATSVADAWSDLEWLACADGKARPTQPGIFPLVNGLPEGMDYSRTGTLKGAGNSIVPQVAAAFVSAYLDVA